VVQGRTPSHGTRLRQQAPTCLFDPDWDPIRKGKDLRIMSLPVFILRQIHLKLGVLQGEGYETCTSPLDRLDISHRRTA